MTGGRANWPTAARNPGRTTGTPLYQVSNGSGITRRDRSRLGRDRDPLGLGTYYGQLWVLTSERQAKQFVWFCWCYART